MNTIPAQEIKRRGFIVVDEIIANGDVHVIKNNQLKYVVVTEERYQALVEAEDEKFVDRVRSSLADLKAGRVKRGKAKDLIAELGLDE